MNNSNRQHQIQQILSNQNLNNSFFELSNFTNLKFKKSFDFIKFLQQKVFSEGFKLSCLHSNKASYIYLRCSQYSNKICEPCKFEINLQAYNYKEKNQFYKITKKINLSHNHPLNKISFVHNLLREEAKRTMINMKKANISSDKIAEYLYHEKSIKITAQQVSSITNNKSKDLLLETDELINKMIDEKSHYEVYNDDADNNCTYRRAIATFTQKELDNLHDFGDFICIDLTFTNMLLNWSLIPISLVGPAR